MQYCRCAFRHGMQLIGQHLIVGRFGFIATVLMIAPAFTAAMDNQALIEAVRAHDNQIGDLEYNLEVVFLRNNLHTQSPGDNDLVSDDPVRSSQYHWRWKGEKLYLAQSIEGVLEYEKGYDGNQARYLHHAARDIGFGPSGIISRKQPDFGTDPLGPWGVAGRLIGAEELLETLSDGRATVHPEMIVEQGHKCILVEGQLWTGEKHGIEGGNFKLILDTECGFMPRRFELFGLDEHGERTYQHIYYDYELIECAPGIWYPVAWDAEVSELKDGQLQLVLHNRNQALSPVRVNQGLSDDQFVVDFPMGTRVLDEIDPNDDSVYIQYIAGGPSVEEHLEGMSGLIVQAVATEAGTGDKKAIPSLPVLSADSQLELEDVPLATGTGRARRSPFLLAGGVGLACLGLVMLAVLWKRQPASADSAHENNAIEQEV